MCLLCMSDQLSIELALRLSYSIVVTLCASQEVSTILHSSHGLHSPLYAFDEGFKARAVWRSALLER